MMNVKNITATGDYKKQFWNAMRGGRDYSEALISGKDDSSGAFILPEDFQTISSPMIVRMLRCSFPKTGRFRSVTAWMILHAFALIPISWR